LACAAAFSVQCSRSNGVPIYEYECKNCGHRFEKIQKFSDDPVKECPKCGGAVEQVLNAPAVQFKGSGWYVTDYARKSGGAAKSGSEAPKDTSADKDPNTKAPAASKPPTPKKTE
jgi:putative FmdB family regulatory protein